MKDNRINMMVEPSLTILEITKINALLERDEPKPAKVEKTGSGSIYYCPSCEKMIFSTDKFCSKCGQRIDEENTAI